MPHTKTQRLHLARAMFFALATLLLFAAAAWLQPAHAQSPVTGNQLGKPLIVCSWDDDAASCSLTNPTPFYFRCTLTVRGRADVNDKEFIQDLATGIVKPKAEGALPVVLRSTADLYVGTLDANAQCTRTSKPTTMLSNPLRLWNDDDIDITQ